MAEAMANKILHRPLTELKKSREEPDCAVLVSSVRRLFELDVEATDSAVKDTRAHVPVTGQGSGEGS